MGSKTISLDDEAYDLLKRAKHGDESFSEVVKRTLSASRPRLSGLAGVLGDEDARAVQATIKDLRRASAKTASARARRVGGR